MTKEKIKTAWDFLDESEINTFANAYKHFISQAKTEYDVADFISEEAEKRDFKNIEECETLKEGDCVYWVFNDRLCMLARIGEKKDALRIIGAHADSPRVELKINPIEEKKDINLGVLKICFYGGFAPYVWANQLLELRGVVYKKGEKRKFSIKNLVIPDHLPHLSRQRFEERKGEEVIKGEEMKVLAGNREIENFKKFVLDTISKEIGIDFCEKDFVRAHLMLIPQYEAIDTGLDKSMIAGYGHDDRACVFTCIKALFEAEHLPCTSVAMIVDKEEIGSESNTSARSEAIKYFFEALLEKTCGKKLREVMIKSRGISADVTAAIAPGFEDCYDITNAAKLGMGVAVERFSNYAGKYWQNEASIKFADWVVEILEKRNIPWQACVVTSKTDKKLGGGGTISCFMARFGMDVIDMGVPTLGMHTPTEIISKADLYATYLAYKAFFEEK